MRRLLMLLCIFALPALAQDKPANLQPLPAVPPPPPDMSSWDSTLQPEVTIKKNDKEVREEFRVNGRLYMIKVTPAGGLPAYYLIDNQGNGEFTRSDVGGPALRTPMWVIKTF